MNQLIIYGLGNNSVYSSLDKKTWMDICSNDYCAFGKPPNYSETPVTP